MKKSVSWQGEVGQKETQKRRFLKFDKANPSSSSDTLYTMKDGFSRLYSQPHINNSANFLYNIPLSLTDEIIKTQKWFRCDSWHLIEETLVFNQN